jgi:hypothetical protein
MCGDGRHLGRGRQAKVIVMKVVGNRTVDSIEASAQPLVYLRLFERTGAAMWTAVCMVDGCAIPLTFVIRSQGQIIRPWWCNTMGHCSPPTPINDRDIIIPVWV